MAPNLISQDSVPYQERLRQNREDGLYLMMDDSSSSRKVDSLPKMHNSASAKRKMVEKRVIRVRAEGNDELQRTNRPPSDSWSWRKYGQKPIKGSPYPRGYYKCSTCNGCSAKKRVERCRNDASILIITYTSTHNHPPTEVVKQQNALTNTVNRPQSTATNPLLAPPTSPTAKTRRLLDKSSFSIQQGNNHGGSSPLPVGQHLEKEQELSPGSTVLSSPSLPLDGNDFFNELEELIPISSSSALDGSTFLL